MKKFNFYLEMVKKINDDKFISIKNIIIKRKDFFNGIVAIEKEIGKDFRMNNDPSFLKDGVKVSQFRIEKKTFFICKINYEYDFEKNDEDFSDSGDILLLNINDDDYTKEYFDGDKIETVLKEMFKNANEEDFYSKHEENILNYIKENIEKITNNVILEPGHKD